MKEGKAGSNEGGPGDDGWKRLFQAVTSPDKQSTCNRGMNVRRESRLALLAAACECSSECGGTVAGSVELCPVPSEC